MKKAIVICLLLISLVFVQPVRKVDAVDIPLNIYPITSTILDALVKALTSYSPGWYNNYRYFIEKFDAIYYVTLVDRRANSKVIIYDQTMDSDNDLDRLALSHDCSTTIICYKMRFNATNGAFIDSNQITSASNEVTLGAQQYNYTNLDQVLKYWGWNDDYSAYEPWYTSLGANYNYGIPEIKVSVLQTNGAVPVTTDQVQTDQLLSGQWVMFDELRQGINAIWNSAKPLLLIGNTGISSVETGISGLVTEMGAWFTTLQDVLLAGMSGILSPLSGILQSAFEPSQTFMNTLYPRYANNITPKLGFLWYPFEWFGGLVTSITGTASTGSFNFGQLFGAPLTLNLNGFKDGAPSLWNFMILMIRGVLSYELISGFYYKVTTKMKGTA